MAYAIFSVIGFTGVLLAVVAFWPDRSAERKVARTLARRD